MKIMSSPFRFSAPDDLTGFSVFLKMDRGMCRKSDVVNGGMIASWFIFVKFSTLHEILNQMKEIT